MIEEQLLGKALPNKKMERKEKRKMQSQTFRSHGLTFAGVRDFSFFNGIRKILIFPNRIKKVIVINFDDDSYWFT